VNTTSPALDSRQRDLLEQAAEWRLISLLFESPTEKWREQIRAIAAEVRNPELRAAAESAQSEASAALHHSIFGPGGPAPAREVSYCESVQLGYLISELEAFYRAFSFSPATPEVLDHVSVEAGFMGYLKLKEAYALACSDAERSAVTGEAATRFLEDHLSVIAHPLAASLRALGVRYLALAAEGLVGRVGPCRKPRRQQKSDLLPILDQSLFDCGSQ
jgi:nitrate reductase assembly molybdenum cofactor insertion protein NarJ